MKSVLFVSIAFPPKNDPECLQTARYFKYLKEQESMQLDVVTSRMHTLFMPYDRSLERYAEGYNQKIELPIYESKLTNYLLRKFSLGKFLFPDSKMTFYWQWKSAVRQLKAKPDVIYSRSNPISSAIMGLRLKKYFKCPWVMHLSDPWSVSPLHKFEGDERQKVMQTEKILFEKADAVTLTSHKTLKLYEQQYPEYAYKLSVMPNVYDPNDVETGEWSGTEKLRVVYTGGITGKRNASFLNNVLTLLNNDDESLLNKVEFIFAGEMDRSNRLFFFQNTWPCIKHIGTLPFSEVKTLYKSAHILLVIDNPTSSDDAIFFPSKILDYFVAKKMIWAVTPPSSTTRDILASYNHVAFANDEVESMAAFLKEAILNFATHNRAFFQVNEVPSEFNAKINATHLKCIFDKIISPIE